MRQVTDNLFALPIHMLGLNQREFTLRGAVVGTVALLMFVAAIVLGGNTPLSKLHGLILSLLGFLFILCVRMLIRACELMSRKLSLHDPFPLSNGQACLAGLPLAGSLLVIIVCASWIWVWLQKPEDSASLQIIRLIAIGLPLQCTSLLLGGALACSICEGRGSIAALRRMGSLVIAGRGRFGRAAVYTLPRWLGAGVLSWSVFLIAASLPLAVADWINPRWASNEEEWVAAASVIPVLTSLLIGFVILLGIWFIFYPLASGVCAFFSLRFAAEGIEYRWKNSGPEFSGPLPTGRESSLGQHAPPRGWWALAMGSLRPSSMALSFLVGCPAVWLIGQSSFQPRAAAVAVILVGVAWMFGGASRFLTPENSRIKLVSIYKIPVRAAAVFSHSLWDIGMPALTIAVGSCILLNPWGPVIWGISYPLLMAATFMLVARSLVWGCSAMMLFPVIATEFAPGSCTKDLKARTFGYLSHTLWQFLGAATIGMLFALFPAGILAASLYVTDSLHWADDIGMVSWRIPIAGLFLGLILSGIALALTNAYLMVCKAFTGLTAQRDAVASTMVFVPRPYLPQLVRRILASLNGKEAAFWHSEGIELARTARYVEAITCYERALRLDRRLLGAHCDKADALINLKNLPSALAAFEDALRIKPKSALALRGKALTLYNQDKIQEALPFAEQAVNADPQLAVAWRTKGAILHRLGKPDEGLACYNRGLEIDPNDPVLWANKGNTLRSLNRLEEAIVCYNRSLEIDRWHDHDNPCYRKAIALEKLWRPTEALEVYQEYLGLASPDESAAIQYTRGRIDAIKSHRTWVVAQSGSGDCLTITAAIQSANPGDHIRVREGNYKEGLVIEKPLLIAGEGPREKIIVETSDKNVICFATDRGRVTNLSLWQKSAEHPHCAVNITQGQLEIENCDIVSDGSSCVKICNGANPILRSNQIHDGKEAGVLVTGNCQATLEDNDIFGNAFAGVEIGTGGNPMLRSNRIHDGKGSGVFIHGNSRGTLEDNDIFGNALVGVAIKTAANPTLRSNRIHDGKSAGILIYDNGQGTLENNDIFGNVLSGVEISDVGNPTLRSNRIHDGKSAGLFIYDNGQGTLEDNDIFGNALAGVAIKTTANPRLRSNRIHDGKSAGISIYDNGQGTLENNDVFGNALSGVEIREGGNPILRSNRIHDGKGCGVLVCKNGQGTLEDNDIFGNRLSGVEIRNVGNPTLRSNRIHDGKSGGLFIYDNGQGTLEDNDIFGNALAGVEIKTAANPTLRSNRIHDGKGSGLFIHDNGQGALEDNDIFGNALAGVEIKTAANPTLRSNRIHDGKGYGVFVHEKGQGTLEDNDIFDNFLYDLKVKPETNPIVGSNRISKTGDSQTSKSSKTNKTTPKFQEDANLFPLYGVTLGVTTIQELEKLGRHATDIYNKTGRPYSYYKINDMKFWYDTRVANHIYMTNSNTMPERWRNLGLDWSLSYNQWIRLLMRLGYMITTLQTPRVGDWQGSPSFEAQVVAKHSHLLTQIELNFSYSEGATADCPSTLYSLRVRA